MKRIFPATIICMAALIGGSCSDQYTICDNPLLVTLNANFYESNGTTGQPAAVPSLTLTQLNGLPIYTGATGFTGFITTLNTTADSTVYHIQLGAGLSADTIRFKYTSTVQQVSPSCGDITVHTLTSVTTTKNTIDSIVIVNPSVGVVLAQNVKVFF